MIDESTPVSYAEGQNRLLLGDYFSLGDDEVKQLVGQQFVLNMLQYWALSDTFGLCGVAGLDAAGKLTRPEVWQTVTYNAAYLKNRFDIKDETGEGLDSADTFIAEHHDKLAGDFEVDQHRGVIDISEWDQLIASLRENEAIIVAYFCDFPDRGSYTHWVAVKPDEYDSVVLLGDFRPFRIKEYGIRMTKENLIAGISKTVGSLSSVQFKGACRN